MKLLFLCFFVFSSIFLSNLTSLTNAANNGRWKYLLNSIGVSAMHMQLLPNDRVVVFDRTDFGPSNLSLPNGNCLRNDCTAHSAEYDVGHNTFRPLTVQSDVWCSSGALMPDGTLIQTGGFNLGDRRVRIFKPCPTCDWQEIINGIGARRWYATNHILPDGRQIIIGGRGQFNYEFYPKDIKANIQNLPFLTQTNDKGVENNLYPFVFLNVDGNLFVFANNRAILLDYTNNVVVKTFPQIPGGDPRSYPSTGSAVLLPLKNLKATNIEAEVLVCGGAPKGSYVQSLKGVFLEALKTCSRIKITDPNPTWVVEAMPQARVMGDMVMLPNGNVLIINGAGSGTAGWEQARDPVLNPVLYRPDNQIGSRFEVQKATTIPRMYHSTAALLRDGRVLVGGSNPHSAYNFTGVLFPTELSLEAFSPAYMEGNVGNLRPKIVLPGNNIVVKHGQTVKVQFTVAGNLAQNLVSVTMVAPSFNTHSFSQNQRLLVLPYDRVKSLGTTTYEVNVVMPVLGNLAPSGYFLFFVVHRDIPSKGIWVRVN